MATMSSLAAEIWELDDLQQPDPTEAEMEGPVLAPLMDGCGPINISYGAPEGQTDYLYKDVKSCDLAPALKAGCALRGGLLETSPEASVDRLFCCPITAIVLVGTHGRRMTAALLTLEIVTYAD